MKIDRWKILAAVVLLAGLTAAIWFVSHKNFPGGQDRASARALTLERPADLAISTSPSPRDSVPRIDSSQALNDALQESDPRKRSMAFGKILAEWFERNPEDALAYIRNMPRGGAEYTEALFIVLSGLGKKDPARAVGLAREMATTREQQAIYSELFDQVVRTDIRTALSLIELVPQGEGRNNALRALAAGWAGQDVLAALDWAKALNDPTERTTAVEATLIIRAKRDPRRTVDLAQQLLTGDALDRTLTEAMKNLVEQDPRAAGEVVVRLPDGAVKTRATLEVVRALAAEQPATALAWIKSLPPGQLQQLALNNVLDYWSANDPRSAGEYVAQMPEGPDQDLAATHFAKNFGATDPSKAVRWAESLKGSARTVALVSIASGWAQKDPSAATRWAAALPVDNPARADAIKDALSYWFLQDYEAARAFLNNLAQQEQSDARPR
jgi:hypothetical protein